MTKQRVREALLHLLEEKNIDRVQVTELCKVSGVHRATFYRYYSSPEDVLLELQKQFVEEIRTNYEVAAIISHPEQYLDDLCKHLYNQKNLIRLIINGISDLDILYYCSKVFGNLLKANAEQKELEGQEQKEMDLLTTYVGGGLYFLLRRWLLEDQDLQPEEMAGFIRKQIRNGSWELGNGN